MRFVRNLSLQEMCLQVVIEDLDKYIYNKIQFIPQKQIDFLLRVYSKECFLRYTKSHSKTEECLLWFLSPHNKNVFLSEVTENVVRKLQVVGPVISSLTLCDAIITENMLNAIMSLVPNVSYLNLRCTNCSDQTLLCIGKMCPKLVTLNLEECEDITDDGMSNLCSNNLLLKNLNILDTAVFYEGLYDILIMMPSLEYLRYENIADAIFAIYVRYELNKIENNIEFNLSKLVYSSLESTKNPLEVISICIELCPYVKEFHLLFPVNPNVLELCSKFVHLKKLQFSFVRNMQDIHLSDTLAPVLPLANNLTTLVLCNNEITPVTLIENFKNLKKLYLKNTSFTDFREEEIKLKYTNLDTLKISNIDMRKATTYKFLVLLISLSKNVTRLTFLLIEHFPAELIDIIIKSMRRLSFVELSCIGSKLPPSYLNFLKIPSMKQVNIDAGDTWFTPVYVAHQSNTLSWRVMSDYDDDDDDDNYDSDDL